MGVKSTDRPEDANNRSCRAIPLKSTDRIKHMQRSPEKPYKKSWLQRDPVHTLPCSGEIVAFLLDRDVWCIDVKRLNSNLW